MSPNERIWIALDVPTYNEAMLKVDATRGKVGGYKVGIQLFTAGGPLVVRTLRSMRVNIFLDLKYHDTPDTVANAAVGAVGLGAGMFTLHITSGEVVMKNTMAAVSALPARPKVLGVTVPTSLTSSDIQDILGVKVDRENLVVHLAKYAQTCGLDGVVCSAREVSLIRRACGSDFLIVVPGTRLPGREVHDQRNVETPGYAVANGADIIIVGRQVIESADPLSEIARIADDIQAGIAKR